MPWWTALLVVLVTAALFVVPGTARQVEALGTRVLAPLQFGVSGAVGQA
jgi:rod shape-determining protein MreC